MILRAAFALLVLSTPAWAADIACPDLSAAIQVGACQTLEQLKWGYTGYCSDNARMYDKDGDSCVTFENYRALKDHSLWEAGEFQGYLTCAMTPEAIKAQGAGTLSVAKAGALTRVVCSYPGELSLVMRTRAKCEARGGVAVCEGP